LYSLSTSAVTPILYMVSFLFITSRSGLWYRCEMHLARVGTLLSPNHYAYLKGGVRWCRTLTLLYLFTLALYLAPDIPDGTHPTPMKEEMPISYRYLSILDIWFWFFFFEIQTRVSLWRETVSLLRLHCCRALIVVSLQKLIRILGSYKGDIDTMPYILSD